MGKVLKSLEYGSVLTLIGGIIVALCSGSGTASEAYGNGLSALGFVGLFIAACASIGDHGHGHCATHTEVPLGDEGCPKCREDALKPRQ